MRNLCLLICFVSTLSFAQRNVRDSSVAAVLFAPNYSFNLTGADLNDRWGFNHKVGLNVGIKLKNQITLDAEGGFIFGNRLNDSTIFESVYNSQGFITSTNGGPAAVLFNMRGATGYVNVGRIFPKVGGVNPNSGLWIQLGFGYLMHKIRIESLYDPVPQLEGDYRKGYDRLTMGFSMKQFVGYMFHANKQLLNFYAGFEFTEGFTQNIRSYQFDLEGAPQGGTFDFLYSIKVGWLIPLYKRAPKEFYYD